jgi:hypothetical protein
MHARVCVGWAGVRGKRSYMVDNRADKQMDVYVAHTYACAHTRTQAHARRITVRGSHRHRPRCARSGPQCPPCARRPRQSRRPLQGQGSRARRGSHESLRETPLQQV